jgi:hypothetical protein
MQQLKCFLLFLPEYNGPSCANGYTGAALAQTGSCISLGLIGIPAFGLPNCPDGATGNLTMGIFGNAAWWAQAKGDLPSLI